MHLQDTVTYEFGCDKKKVVYGKSYPSILPNQIIDYEGVYMCFSFSFSLSVAFLHTESCFFFRCMCNVYID